MYKQHIHAMKDVERKAEDVVREMGSIIDTLSSQLKHIDIGTASSTLQKLKANNEKLNEVIKKLVTKNKELEETIKIQNTKINSLEASIVKMKADIKSSKEDQAQTNKSLQAQIDELKKTLKVCDSKVEKKMSSIVTTVMAAHRFKNALKNREGEKPGKGEQRDKLQPQ